LIDFVQKTTLQSAIISGEQTSEWGEPRGQKVLERNSKDFDQEKARKNARARETSNNGNVVGELHFH